MVACGDKMDGSVKACGRTLVVVHVRTLLFSEHQWYFWSKTEGVLRTFEHVKKNRGDGESERRVFVVVVKRDDERGVSVK